MIVLNYTIGKPVIQELLWIFWCPGLSVTGAVRQGDAGAGLQGGSIAFGPGVAEAGGRVNSLRAGVAEAGGRVNSLRAGVAEAGGRRCESRDSAGVDLLTNSIILSLKLDFYLHRLRQLYSSLYGNAFNFAAFYDCCRNDRSCGLLNYKFVFAISQF